MCQVSDVQVRNKRVLLPSQCLSIDLCAPISRSTPLQPAPTRWSAVVECSTLYLIPARNFTFVFCLQILIVICFKLYILTF
jgi:hypothetical protein